MNIPSHYQSAFFRALDDRDDIDLRVVYLSGACEERAAEGWRDTHEYQPYELGAEGVDLDGGLESVLPDWKERIHVISGNFSASLVDLFCREGVAWCHWSEMPGIRLAELLDYRVPPFRLLNPLMLACKRKEGRRIGRHALGAFGQGALAHKAFRLMGIPQRQIADLFYTPGPLESARPCRSVVEFAKGRKVFLSVGALCRRKGIDLLLKAFARLKGSDWCLVLCGLDRSGGEYLQLAAKLGIADRVFFLGAYPSDRIAEVYAASDVFVLPSRFDGWGAVLNEAASLGLPLVGTDLCGASWHVIRDGVNGHRVKAGSTAALARAMASYVADPGLCSRFGDASRLVYAQECAPQRNAERLVEALHAWSRA